MQDHLESFPICGLAVQHTHSVNTKQGSGIRNGAAIDNLRNFTENIKIIDMENGKKFDVKECVRLTSIGCTSEAQVVIKTSI